MTRLSFRCERDLIDRVDRRRGMVPREPWLRLAVEFALAADELLVDNPHVPPERRRAVEEALSAGSAPAAPPEQPRGVGRLSSSAKQGVAPVLKGGR